MNSQLSHGRRISTAGSVARASASALLILYVASVTAQTTDAGSNGDSDSSSVIIHGVRPTDAGPLPGLLINKDQIPANVQTADHRRLEESRALNVGDFMRSQLQGVSANDYSGNPFQMDVNYRGFTASPQVGTPVGLSVFFDGIRVNEAFGDVVNWDLIPMNALERFDLFPGSNPLFGLNTLGGAISVRTRSGFSSPGIEASASGGSWGRRQIEGAAGGNNGAVGGFLAATIFDEDGWRDNSPSKVRQVFGRADWRGRYGVITATTLYAQNNLIGNGLIPIELYDERPGSVFTSPDQSRNRVSQFALSGVLDVSDRLNITAQTYHRASDRSGLNGDIYEGFQDFDPEQDLIYDLSRPPGQQGITRNGAQQYLGVGGITTGTGVVDGTPIGLLTWTALHQSADGGALQANWNAESDKLMVGASIDRSHASYDMWQRLGLITAAHEVYLDPGNIAPQYYGAAHNIPGNDFHGTETTRSVYLTNTWSVLKNLHVTLAGRYNWTGVDSDLYVRTDSDGIAELRSTSKILDQLLTQQTHTKEGFNYSSFNPELGVNLLPVPTLNLYGNISRGARVPSVVELGCAFDSTPVDISVGSNIGTAPRSLVGPGCTLPTTLSGDPYLPQIRSTSEEVGARGHLGPRLNWDLSLYRTDLTNDIYFVGVGDGKSYFDTIGRTRRQGLEIGMDGSFGVVDIRANYSFTDATFQSPFYTVSPYNGSADFDQNSQSAANNPGLNGVVSIPSPTAGANKGRGTYEMIRIDPGARLPGIPRHTFNATVTVHPTRLLHLAATVVGSSFSYVRGNENNLHQPGGTDQQTGLYYCANGAGGCGPEGLMQQFVPPGRPFVDAGTIPGYAVVNLDAGWSAGRGLTVFVLVNNLFDRTYFTAGRLGINPFVPPVHGAIGPSGWNYNSSEWRNTTYVGPGAPRAVWAGFTFEWKTR